MSTEPLDELIASTMRSRAEGVGDVGDLVPRVEARAASLRRRQYAAVSAVAAAAIAAVAGLVPLLGVGGEPDSAPPIAPVPSTTAEVRPPPSSNADATALTREDALLRELAAHDDVRRAMIFRVDPVGMVLCGINIVGTAPGDTELYVWLACGDFTTGPEAEMLSASSGPAVVTIAGQGAQTKVLGVELPRQERLEADIDRMFPDPIAGRMIRGEIATTPSLDELLQQARDASPAS